VGSRAFPIKKSTKLSRHYFEVLGLKWALEKFHGELTVLESAILGTDCAALAALHKSKVLSPEQNAVKILSMPFASKLKIIHKPGRNLILTNYFSRYMSKCDFKKEQNVSEDVWALPVERESMKKVWLFLNLYSLMIPTMNTNLRTKLLMTDLSYLLTTKKF